MTENEENKMAMMCWEVLKDSPKGKSLMKNQRTKERNLSKKTQKPKDEEEHVDPTLNIGN